MNQPAVENFAKESDFDIDVSKYETETLVLIYYEAAEQLTQTFVSYRANKNMSIIALGIYFSIISLGIANLIDMNYSKSDNLFLMLTLSMIISSCLLYKNILPTKMIIPGCQPKKLIHPFYEKFKGEEQQKQFYRKRLVDINSGIEKNRLEVSKGSQRLRHSITFAVTMVPTITIANLLLF